MNPMVRRAELTFLMRAVCMLVMYEGADLILIWDCGFYFTWNLFWLLYRMHNNKYEYARIKHLKNQTFYRNLSIRNPIYGWNKTSRGHHNRSIFTIGDVTLATAKFRYVIRLDVPLSTPLRHLQRSEALEIWDGVQWLGITDVSLVLKTVLNR